MWFSSPTYQYYTCTIHKFSFSFLPLEMIAYCILLWKQQNACWPSCFSSMASTSCPFFPQWSVLTCISMLYLCLGCHLLPHSLRVHWTLKKQNFFIFSCFPPSVGRCETLPQASVTLTTFVVLRLCRSGSSSTMCWQHCFQGDLHPLLTES